MQPIKDVQPKFSSPNKDPKKDKSRNVNSFKMKGMSSLGPEGEGAPNVDRYPNAYQVVETEVLEDNFIIPKPL